MISSVYKRLSKIALNEFSDIAIESRILSLPSGVPLKIRLYLIDDTIVDIWISASGKYSYHWEQRDIRDIVYRHDNAPHERWKYVKTFPKHFHCESEDNVCESDISDDPEEAIREFLLFIRVKLKEYFLLESGH